MPPYHGQEPTASPALPQSIPLQDLARPPDYTEQQPAGRRSRGRSLLGNGSLHLGIGNGQRYDRLDNASPDPSSHRGAAPNQSAHDEVVSPMSPVDNPADFQAAMGFAGLTIPTINLPDSSNSRSASSDSLHRVASSTFSNYDGGDLGESDIAYIHSDCDRVPLTDPRHLQPISGSYDGSVEGRSGGRGLHVGGNTRHNRSQSYGATLSPGGYSRSRSASTSDAFSRASSIVRAMSQRVVNLSGEAEFIEESARREATMTGNVANPQPYFHPETAYKPDAYLPPPEKGAVTSVQPAKLLPWKAPKPENPLKGNTLGVFSPENRLRNKLCDILVSPITEPVILALIVLQTVLLTIDSARSVYDHPRRARWGHTFTDYALLGLFILFSLEIVARSIVSGFLFNAAEYSSIDRARGFRGAVTDKYRTVFAPDRTASTRRGPIPALAPSVNPLTAFPGFGAASTVEEAQRLQLARRAFLRHSFNRLDLVAVMAYWAAFALSITGIEESAHIFVFQMLSCLRILRLLAVTNGTAIILRSLKKATPLLLNVSFLIGFFWLLFAIIGMQGFKGSFDRQCVWVDPDDRLNQSNTAFINTFQYCGGQFNNDSGVHDPWLRSTVGDNPLDNLVPGADSPKGFLCPRGSVCLELPRDRLPYNGTFNFDNIAQSLELVFVVMSANTFSDVMYYATNSEYLAAALFFAFGIVIMTFWLMNLLIAVITSSFQVIREEGRASAFAATLKEEGIALPEEPQEPARTSTFQRLYQLSFWLWIALIAFDLMCMASRSAHMSSGRRAFIDISEIIVTIMLAIEICFRFSIDWRAFHKSWRNWFDLLLAVITLVILLPPIKHSGQPYAWLTAFQILRVYRLVMAVRVTRELITLVLGNASGIANLMLFVFMMSFLISIFAVQLFRGEIAAEDAYGNTIQTTFFTIWNAFLGMYQVLSSENWTAIMYTTTAFDDVHNTAWIGAIFFIAWFIFGNLILINMFIAVIQENFDVSEDEKRMQQVKAFLHRKELGSTSSNLSLAEIFKFGRSNAKKDPLDYGPATMEMLLKDAVVRDFLDEETTDLDPEITEGSSPANEAPVVHPGALSNAWGKFLSRIWKREPNPFYSNIKLTNVDDNTNAKMMAKEAVSATSQRKKAQREYLARHPNYNNSLFIFKPNNFIRRWCQRVVGPGRGSERFQGVEPNRTIWFAFSAAVYMAIVVMVLLACVTTPLYQRRYALTHDGDVDNWIVLTDLAFSIFFSVEALIKVLADGFFWTPNAYYRSTWGFIDGIVLITLWINVLTSLTNDGSVARAVGAFKALRALRLLNISDSARNTFHSVILVGGRKLLSAAFVSLSLLIPFAIFGLNLFNGQFEACNDGTGDISDLADCSGEWQSTPYSSQWNMTAPRVVSNPYYDFDNFGGALFILFQIVSQEGWIDVMWSAQSIVGRGRQPKDFSSQGNAVFFVVFNLLATIFVLTLFISVFMRNYTEQTGVAFLTADQRSWMELRKLLKQVSPSKRPTKAHYADQSKAWKDWCYKRATRKHGKWHQATTVMLACHLVLLLTEYNSEPDWRALARDYVFLGFTVFYIANIAVRIIGLSWYRFRRSSWDLFSLFAVFGTLVTTIYNMVDRDGQTVTQLHKLFLVSIVLLLIPRNDALDQLFKTAAASLTTIGNLLATWLVLFLVFAIALTQTFGLTRFGSQGTDNLNFRTVPKALILLFRMSCGEGWNEIMEDYAAIVPPLCNDGGTFFESDCGSLQWARGLFISWNILSMYIFTSLFVSLIYESFSYVYQRSSGLGKVNREELRRFKQAWAALDPAGTGYISKEQFPRLLGELSGAFEMRIYSHEDSVRGIMEDVASEPITGRITSLVGMSTASGIDLKALNYRLSKIDTKTVRRNRIRYNLFYEEVMVSADADRGIAFTTVLMILAHYNVISDSKSLKLEEFLRRRARLQRVEEEVRRRIVVGFFDTLYWSRRFRKHMEMKSHGRMTAIPQLGPEVYVDDEGDIAKPRPPVGVGSPLLTAPSPIEARQSFITHGFGDDRERWTHSRDDSWTSERSLSPQRRSEHGVSPQSSPHRSTQSGVTLDGTPGDEGSTSANGSRRNSGANSNNVLEVLDNSAWGASIRRSFTQKRPEGRPGFI